MNGRFTSLAALRATWLPPMAAFLAATGAIPAAAQQNSLSRDLEVIQLRPNFDVIVGAGANILVQFGSDGAVLVDAGDSDMSDSVLEALKKVTSEPIRYVINTSADPGNVGGNANLSKAGASLNFARGNNIGGKAAAVLSREGVLNRMSAPTGKAWPFPIDAWPTETFFTKQKVMYLNGEGIQVIAMPAAHTDADSIVYFRRSDVIAAGNIVDTRHFPVIDLENGGSIQGEIDSLNRLVEMAIPSIPLVNQEGGTFVVPGHGRICDQGDLVEYRDMVVIIRDVIRDMLRQGMTLEQIQRSSPASGYSTRYGSDSGPWTTNQFVEAIYRSLKEKK
jgi:cyclase